MVRNPPANAGDAGSIPGPGRFPWRRKWQTTLKKSWTVFFLPEKVHGQRSLGGYSSWGRKEWDMTKATEQAHINSGSTEENHGK